MKKCLGVLFIIGFMCFIPHKLFSQSASDLQELGISVGGFTNFPANQHYLEENIGVFYATPYVRTGRHEFSAGILYPLSANALNNTAIKVKPLPGATAGYKFYVFNIFGRENMFIHYSFQYLMFRENYEVKIESIRMLLQVTETDRYINNVIGLGYSLYFDENARFGLFYTLNYVISQSGYKVVQDGGGAGTWTTKVAWNNLSTNIGLTFKLIPLKKNAKN